MKKVIGAFLILLTSINFVEAQTPNVLTPSGYTYDVNPATGYSDLGNELTNGQNPSCVWPSSCSFTEYVGWENTNPEFTFNFGSQVAVTAVRIWMADSDGAAGVALPVSATIDPNGSNQTVTISNPSGTGLRNILIPLTTPINTNTLTIRLNRNTSQSWTMISEVQVEGIPSSWTGDHIFNTTANVPISIDLTGTGKLIKGGSGTLTLEGNNTFTGGFTINGGSGQNSIIQATSSNAFGTGLVEILGASGNTGSTLDLNGQTLTNDITIGNKNSGVNSEGAIINTDVNNPATLNGTVVIGGENYAGGDGDIIFNSLVSGGLSNIYSIYKMGNSTWRFTNDANTFDGFFYLIDGTVEVTSLANDGQASSLGQVSASQNQLKFGFNNQGGGTLRFVGGNANTSNRNFELLGASSVTNIIAADGSAANANLVLTGNLSPSANANYTVAFAGANNGANAFSGILSNGSGNLSIIKNGIGQWIFTGNNTYTGTTTVSAGTLLVNGNQSAATGAVSVATGATLGGSGTLGGAINFQNGSFFAPGTSPGILTAANGLTLSTGSTFNWELAANSAAASDRGTAYDGANVTGGGLTIQSGVNAELDFTMGVDFTDAFWQSPQQWLVFENANAPTLNSADIFDNISFTVDANNVQLNTIAGAENSYFFWTQVGNDLYLNYQPLGNPSLTQSTLTASPNGIAINGTSTLTVQLKDQNGNNFPNSGGTITFATTLGSIGTVTNNNDGTYTATFIAGATTGTATITASLNNTALTNTVDITIVTQILSGNQIIDGTSGNTQVTDVFTTDGNLTLEQGFFVDYLIVGGGGGGGNATAFGNGGGGGGGAGRFVEESNKQLSVSSHSITVGGGGATGASAGSNGSNGGISSAFGQTAPGGGGGSGGNNSGSSGGSGGGSRGAAGGGTQNGSPLQGFGNNGFGTTSALTGDGAGGGGGAGSSGGSYSTSGGGAGGDGIQSSITGTNLWYAAGGGGGGAQTTNFGIGGNSIGGNGANNDTAPTPGASNTGSGGGGGNNNRPGASGGSGVVIVRYKGAEANSTITASANAVSILNDSYQLYEFTSVGSNSFNLSNAIPGAVLSNAISGSGDLIYNGPGRLTLPVQNTYTGNTYIGLGQLRINHSNALGTGYVYSGTSSGSGIGTNGALEISGDLNINNAIKFYANGTASTSRLVNVSGTNTLSGNITLDFGGEFYGISADGGSLLLTGDVERGNATNNRTLYLRGEAEGILSGMIDGSGFNLSIIKEGNGVWELSGANTYTGSTTVNAGALVINGSQSGATGTLAVNNGATLKGSGTVGGTTTINSGATLKAADAIGEISFSNDLNLQSGGHLNWKITDATGNAGSNWDKVNVTGALNINATNTNTFNINIWSVLANGQNGQLTNFNPTEQFYEWTLIEAGSITGFSADKFTVHIEANNGAGGLSSNFQVDGFEVIQDGNELVLRYDPPAAQTIDGTNNGTEIANYTTSNTTGSLTLDLGFFADYLIVGGGGGGGSRHGGGGGAGGVVSNFGQSPFRLFEQNYSITVGNGGAGANAGSNTIASKGGNSIAFGLTAFGGGAGSSSSSFNNLQNGASGGGSRGNSSVAGGGRTQGNIGGSGVPQTNANFGLGGGGGGFSQQGNNAEASSRSKGGDGFDASPWLGNSFGDNGWFAGGGAGGGSTPSTAALGGFGGGGNGNTGTSNTAQAGQANTGGGGAGGGHNGGTNFAGKNGGAGIVIVKHEGPSILDETAPNGVGINAGYFIHTFTSSGNFDLSQVDFDARLKATLSGNIIGNGALIYDSKGRLTLTGTNHTYTGATSIQNGELRVNSDITSSSGVTVASTATLSGTGTLPATEVYGAHNPGSEVGVQTVAGDLTYKTGSTINWELFANAIGTRGTDYDGIDVTGDLDFEGATTLNLVFNTNGSAVDWNDPFWNISRYEADGWKLFSVTGTTTGLNNVTLPTANLLDVNGVALNSVYPDIIGFELKQVGNDVYLSFVSSTVWYGNNNDDWSTNTNWLSDRLPIAGEGLIIAGNAQQDLVLDQSYQVADIKFAGADKKIVLAGHNLTFTGLISGADANNYIQTNGTGKLISSIPANGTVRFEVGRSAYNPVEISPSISDEFTVLVKDTVENNTNLHLAIYVDRTWEITKADTTAGGSVNFVYYWNANEIVNGPMNQPILNHYNGNNWENANGINTPGVVNPILSLTHTNYTGAFSPFAISDASTPLPVDFLGMQYECLNQQGVALTWQTASELNAQHFEVMRSEDGFTWEKVGTVGATGTTNQLSEYQFMDESPVRTALRYYQLKQVDFDGAFEWLPIISVNCEAGGDMRLYPNPAQSQVVLEFTHDTEENLELGIYDALGREVKVEQIAAMIGFNRVEFNVSELPSGAYQLRLGQIRNPKPLNLLINR